MSAPIVGRPLIVLDVAGYSGTPTDITEEVIREVVLATGLVDVKVCAADDAWSGLDLVVRKELREPPN